MSTQGAGGFRQGAGRPKGALGEKTKAVQAKLDQLGCDPIEALANISMDNISLILMSFLRIANEYIFIAYYYNRSIAILLLS